jgi:superfamily II DNA or RNA helicase|tara:strand:+ start:347 stop:1501 length:1155 start_codon:yes stop_codon:yes gene_type:complete
MKLYETKDKEQRRALNNWHNNDYCGTIIAGTGFGKSRCGVMAINHVLNTLGGTRALVLVPTTQLKDQFKEEFKKWDCEDCLEKVEVVCYQSAYKLKNEHYDIVVCDEIHLGLSNKYRQFFNNNVYDRILCLTATPPEEPMYKLHLHLLAPTVYTLTLDECVAMKLVAPYEIYCIPLELTEEERIEYKKVNNKFVEHKMALDPDAFQYAKIALSSSSVSYEMKAHAAGFYKTIRERKAIVDKAHNKISKFKEIVYSNLDKKIITFGGLNDFTDMLAQSVSPLAEVYHSKIATKKKREALRRFKEGEVNILCSTKALNQGFDIPNANLGIICGLTSKSLSMIQRVGRLIRYEEGKIGKVYVLYVKDSQEEKWLKNAVYDLKGVKWL